MGKYEKLGTYPQTRHLYDAFYFSMLYRKIYIFSIILIYEDAQEIDRNKVSVMC